MMARKTVPAIYLCGGDYGRLQSRSDCPNTLHDWPLPAGYGESFEVAEARLRNRWRNKRCPNCGLYGWEPGEDKHGTNPVRVPA